MINRDVLHLIFSYVNLDEFYKIKKEYRLSVKRYCNNVVNLMTQKENSFLEYKKYTTDYKTIDWVCYCGYTEVLNYLVDKGDRDFTSNAIDFASMFGHFNIVKLLYLYKMHKSKHAFDWASGHNELRIVKFLYKIGERGTTNAMDYAATNGHLKIVKYLYSIGMTGTTSALDGAIINNHLNVARFLQEIGYTCSNSAIKKGYYYGGNRMAKFLSRFAN